jgi:glycosyltransferase involved in cell wall biosynthesis
MIMNPPRVSIVTPSYNQGQFLERTIISVLEQGYPNLEYIVMDGGSTDDSVEIIRKYARHLTYWQSQPDAGQADAINAGLQMATGQILTYLNSDDFLLGGSIQHVAELYRKYPQAAGWVGGAYHVAPDGYILQSVRPLKVGRDDLANWRENAILQPAFFFSASIARQLNFFNTAYENAFDFDFILRITVLGRLVQTPRFLAAAGIHRLQKTTASLPRTIEEVQEILRKYGYAALADAEQKTLQQARAQRPISTRAKLMYMTHAERRSAPDRFVRLPQNGPVPNPTNQRASGIQERA